MREFWFQKNQKNNAIRTIAIMIVVVFGVGTTYAYNLHSIQQDNRLKASKVEGEIIENGNFVEEESSFLLVKGGTTKKEVQFKNTGVSAVFVRVSFGETWRDGFGAWLTGDNEYVTLHWTKEWEDEWQLGDDGWYYYKKILEPNTLTAEVLTAVEFESDENLPLEYQSAYYQLFFTMESVQYSEDMEVNDGALESVFDRSATVTDGVVTWE